MAGRSRPLQEPDQSRRLPRRARTTSPGRQPAAQPPGNAIVSDRAQRRGGNPMDHEALSADRGGLRRRFRSGSRHAVLGGRQQGALRQPRWRCTSSACSRRRRMVRSREVLRDTIGCSTASGRRRRDKAVDHPPPAPGWPVAPPRPPVTKWADRHQGHPGWRGPGILRRHHGLSG